MTFPTALILLALVYLGLNLVAAWIIWTGR